jgi:aminopeptidase-like protein
MYVIIDWHILHDNNPRTYEKEAIEFFDEMSKLYADVPNVLYEICNEPSGEDVTWDKVIKPYAINLIETIRNYFNNYNELFDIRVPNHNLVPEGTTYSNAGEAVRDQFEQILTLINNIKTQVNAINTTEVEDIRTPNQNLVPEGTVYDNAGEAVRGQFEEMLKLITNINTELDKKMTKEEVDAAIESAIGAAIEASY